MQTQFTCPQCGTAYTTEVHQVVDSKRTPGLKQQLLNGQLNVAVCPNCGMAAQLASLLLFHDPEHEMFIVHVPPQLNMSEMEREQAIGKLTQQVMDNLPPEERRAYMLQPQMILNMQTFLEKVLETEGITKEMIERQKEQGQLLNTLINADKDVADHLIQERIGEIDETFFAMLQSYIDQASQMNDDKQMVKLTNLRARLMTNTPVGRRLEQQQIALHKLNRAAKQEGGVTPELLLEQIVDHVDQYHVMQALATAVQGSLSYEFFQLLTEAIDKRKAAKDRAAAANLAKLRDELIEAQQQMREASQKMVDQKMQALQAIMQAPDKDKALNVHADQIDDAFMYVLSTRMAQAQQDGNMEEFQALNEIQALVMDQIEGQLPPPVRLLNKLVRTESVEAQQQLLAENERLLDENLIAMLDQVIAQAQENQQNDELNTRLLAIKNMIEARVG